MKKGNIEKALKSFLKKKVSYSFSLLIIFMITGGISLSAGITAENTRETKNDILIKIQMKREKIKRQIVENEKLISKYNLEYVELLRKGNFYSKPLFESTQIFFPITHEYNGKGKDRTEKEFRETLNAVKEFREKRGENSELASKIAKDQVMAGNGIVIKNETFRETIEVGANIKLIQPDLPVVNPNISVTASAPEVNLGALPKTINPTIVLMPSVEIPMIKVPKVPNGISVPVSTPSAMEKILVASPIITSPNAPVDKNIVISVPTTPGGFTPKFIALPIEPTSINVTIPTILNAAEINFKGKGFGQSAKIGMPKNNIILENYDTYDTVNKDTNEKGIINIEVDGTTKWWGSNLDGTKNSNVQLRVTTNVPNTVTPDLTIGGYNPAGAGTFYLEDGSSGVGLNAFINELRDHNATISGNYVMTNKGGANSTTRNTIFLSHNPAGVGSVPGGIYDGQGKAEAKTATFNANLTINGTATPFTGDTAHSDITIGVEHQLWSKRAPNEWTTEGAYSIFDNKGTINLASGYNMVGILIDVEAWGDNSLNDNSGVPHKTINSGKILINGGNSIGIDYGEYSNLTFKSELIIGDIIVNGNNNYGLRMANIFTQNPTYFDKGVTIDSGGVNKKILVQGRDNIGVSIAKFLSSAVNSNPIANITGLNIEVNGIGNVGFLRHKNYENNAGDMILNTTTMGTFSFGDDAEKSTLIRTDKHNIKIEKDISVSKGKNDNSFAQAVSNGFYYKCS